MARTTNEIQQDIIDRKEAETDLNALNSTSQTAVWRLWTRITAAAMRTFELLVDELKADITEIAISNSYGTAIWWQREVKTFQYSASNPQELIIDENYNPTYATIDEDLQIITKSSVRDDAGSVLIMVAKDSGALSSNELTAFDGFVRDIQPAGILTTVRSENPDVIRITADVYYDAEIGESQTLSNIEESVEDYLSTLNERGELYVQRVVDAIQAAEGVVDVDPATVTVEERRDTESIANYDTVSRTYDAYAGFATRETDGSNDLASTLTMIQFSA